MKWSKNMKKKVNPLLMFLRLILTLILILVLVAAVYVAYVLIDYHRIDDNQILTPGGTAQTEVLDADAGKTYHLTDWNIGFAAYTDQFSFFMDGGLYSRAFSRESRLRSISMLKGIWFARRLFP